MKIVHLLNHTRKANGHVEMALDLACEQVIQGHEVTIVAGAGDFDACMAEHGVGFVRLPEHTGPLAKVHMALGVAAACRRLKPDVVNAHMVTSALIARATKLLSPFALVTTVHNSFDGQARLMGVGDRVIAVSDAVNREMVQKGLSPARLKTVHNGTIGGKRRTLWPSQTETLAGPAIATVAGLHSRKGIATILDAFDVVTRAVPDAQLYLVGEGPERAELMAKAEGLACAGHVHFLGYRPDPRAVLASTDIFVLASLAEPCGLALIEARQMGCACVATQVGGSPEVLGFGEKGLLFQPSQPQELATILLELLQDEKKLAAFKYAARSDLDYWTVKRMAHQTVEVYEAALRSLQRAVPAAETA